MCKRSKNSWEAVSEKPNSQKIAYKWHQENRHMQRVPCGLHVSPKYIDLITKTYLYEYNIDPLKPTFI